MIKFMSSDFFVLCFIVVNFEEIWTRPYRDVVKFWQTKYNKKWSISTLRETYINWNWLDQAWDRFCRDALYEMNACTRCEVSSIKVGFKMLSWWLERNMLLCFFRLFTENVSGFAFITKFSKIFVWTSPGAFDRLKVDVLNLFTSPGAFEILCQVFFLNWLTPLKLTLKKKWIVQDLLTARLLVEVWRWKGRKFSEIFRNFQVSWNDLLSSSKMMLQKVS
jgi:hypothetical protein